VMLILGGGIGLHALWLDGWTLAGKPPGWPSESTPVALPAPHFVHNSDLAQASSYLCYFALVFLALRWWKMTDRRRPQRFSFAPVLAAGFWSVLLMLVLPRPAVAVALVLASVVVQLVSPWEPPPRPAAKPMRLRYA